MADEPPFSPRQLGELLALLAHDLRNPLAAVLANLGYLGDTGVGETKEVVSDTMAACDALRRIVANIDVLSQTLTLTTSLPQRLEVLPALRVVIDELGPSAVLAEVRMEVATSGEGLAVFGPPEALPRALGNLLGNALAHAPARSIVKASVTIDGESVLVTICDEGEAISAAELPALLTPEGQVSSHQRGRERYSRGLGLWCAELSARALGGRVEVLPSSSGSALALRAPRVA